MIAAEFFQLSRIVFERVFGALVDAAYRNLAMLLLLANYAATWSLYVSIARSLQTRASGSI
jgi:hypothetical protein